MAMTCIGRFNTNFIANKNKQSGGGGSSFQNFTVGSSVFIRGINKISTCPIAMDYSGKYVAYDLSANNNNIYISTDYGNSYTLFSNNSGSVASGFKFTGDGNYLIFQHSSGTTSKNFAYINTSNVTDFSLIVCGVTANSPIVWCTNYDGTKLYTSAAANTGGSYFNVYRNPSTTLYSTNFTNYNNATTTNNSFFTCNSYGDIAILGIIGTSSNIVDVSFNPNPALNIAPIVDISYAFTNGIIPDISNNNYYIYVVYSGGAAQGYIWDISPNNNIAILVTDVSGYTGPTTSYVGHGNYYVAYNTSGGNFMQPNTWKFFKFDPYPLYGSGILSGRVSMPAISLTISDGQNPNIYFIQNNSASATSQNANTNNGYNVVYYLNTYNNSLYYIGKYSSIVAPKYLAANKLILVDNSFNNFYYVTNNLIPAPPTNLSLSNITTTSIIVNYTASIHASGGGGGSTIIYYAYTAPVTSTFSSAISGTSITLTGLTQGTTYTINVYAQLTSNSSLPNPVQISGTTEQLTDPSSLSLSNITTTSMVLTFTESTTNGTGLTYYATTSPATSTFTSTTTTINLTDLTQNTTYTVYLYAQLSDGSQSSTVQISGTTSS